MGFAVCCHQLRGEMPQSAACRLVVTVNRATSATGRQLAFKPRRGLPGRHGLGSRLQQLDHQPIGALALTLEIGPVTRCRCLEPRDLGLQRHDLYLQSDVARLATTTW